jgi:hypothetical protein
LLPTNKMRKAIIIFKIFAKQIHQNQTILQIGRDVAKLPSRVQANRSILVTDGETVASDYYLLFHFKVSDTNLKPEETSR